MVTALFGEKKFGEFLFGDAPQTRNRFALNIDWNNDGFFDGRNDAVFANALSWERGRRYVITSDGSGFEEEMTGKMLCTLLDSDGFYDPFGNTDIGAGRLFRLSVRTPSGTVHALMAGMLGEPGYTAGRGRARLQINGEDGWGFLRDQKNRANVELQQSIAGDTAMDYLLDSAGWPRTWGRDLGAGQDVHPYWWAENKSTAKAMHDLAFSELGRIWIAGNGAMAFRNRHVQDTSAFTITDDDVYLGSLRVVEPWDVVRNSVRVESIQRTQQSDIELWRSIEAIRLTPGATYEKFIDFTYNGEAVPVVSLTAPEAGVDYTANTAIDGGGLDMTSSIGVTVEYFSTRGKLTLVNNGSNAGYVLVPFVIRGSGLVRTSNQVQYESDASIQKYGVRSLDISYEWIHNENVARYIARRLRDRLSTPKRYLEFEMRANVDPDKQFGLDLGTQVDVDIVSKGVSGTYRVMYLRGAWADAAGITSRLQVMLEPVEDVLADLWVVPTTVPMVVA